MALVPAVRSEAATTLGERCPHYHRCYYHSAVAQAREADVLVINQSLAFAWPARYPKLDHLVLDEAHEVEDVATTALVLGAVGPGLRAGSPSGCTGAMDGAASSPSCGGPSSPRGARRRGC